MLINPSTPVNYRDVVAFVQTQKRVNESSLAVDLWIDGKDAAAFIKRLREDKIIGSAYIKKTSITPGHILYYDVITNNKKPQSSPWWQLWGHKLETGFLFTRFLLRAFKNRLTGKKDPLDVVGNATKAAATELKLDYILGIDYQLDGSRHYRVELKENVDGNKAEDLVSRLRNDQTLKSYEISRSKSLLKFSPTA